MYIIMYSGTSHHIATESHALVHTPCMILHTIAYSQDLIMVSGSSEAVTYNTLDHLHACLYYFWNLILCHMQQLSLYS